METGLVEAMSAAVLTGIRTGRLKRHLVLADLFGKIGQCPNPECNRCRLMGALIETIESNPP